MEKEEENRIMWALGFNRSGGYPVEGGGDMR